MKIILNEVIKLEDKIEKLEDENLKLQQKIEQAIEYIKENIEDEYKYDGLLYFNKSKYELLAILGDKE